MIMAWRWTWAMQRKQVWIMAWLQAWAVFVEYDLVLDCEAENKTIKDRVAMVKMEITQAETMEDDIMALQKTTAPNW